SVMTISTFLRFEGHWVLLTWPLAISLSTKRVVLLILFTIRSLKVNRLAGCPFCPLKILNTLNCCIETSKGLRALPKASSILFCTRAKWMTVLGTKGIGFDVLMIFSTFMYKQ